MQTVPVALRLLTIPITAAVVLAGVWVTGALLTNNFLLAMALTTAWMAGAGVAAVVVAVHNRALRWPVLGAYAVTAVTSSTSS